METLSSNTPFFNAYFFALVGYAWSFGALIIFIK